MYDFTVYQINVKKNNQKRHLFFLIIFFYINIVPTSWGQHISKALDSIHAINEKDFENIHLYDSLLLHYKKTENYTQLGSDAHQLAKWLRRENKLNKTIEVLRTGIEARKIAVPYDPELLKRSYINLGYYYKLNKDYVNEMQVYMKMLAVKESSKFNEVVYILIGDLYAKQKEYKKAIEYYKKAFVLYDDKTSTQKLISYHYNLSNFYNNLKEINTHFRTIKYHLLIADSLNNNRNKKSVYWDYGIKYQLGELYVDNIKNRDLQKAKSYYKEAITYIKKLHKNEDVKYANCYYNLGRSYMNEDSLDIAKEYYLKSLGYNNGVSKYYPYVGLALLEEKRKNYDISQAYLDKALSSVLGYDVVGVYDDLITDELLKKSKYVSKILSIFSLKINYWLAQLKLEVEDESTIYNSIFRTIEMSDVLLEDVMTNDLPFNIKLLYKDLETRINIKGLEASYQTNDLEKAFSLMEKSKAVLLIHDIEKQMVALPKEIVANKIKKEKRIEDIDNKILLSWGTKKDSLIKVLKNKEVAYANYLDSIAVVFPNYSYKNKTIKPLHLNDINVPKNELIIQYTMVEMVAGEVPEAYVMMMTHKGNQLFKLDNIKLLLERITKLRELLNQPFKTAVSISEFKMIAYDLYIQLFPEEIRKELKGKKVKIIPDHLLGMIPFDALVTNKEANTYLIEDTEISYTYSLSFSKENASRKRVTSEDFLGIAPIHFTDDLAPLKSSGKEIEIANSLYQGDVFLGSIATKENYKTQVAKYRILHLATHADAKDTDTIQPWIAFSKSKLTDLELSNVENNADLVMLSACNTSLGDVRRGEGALSLARSFFKSGAKSVIPSLWSINDKAMTTITGDFYKNLSQGQTKSAALRNAKLTYLHSNTDAEASPHYWAPLILIGDNGVLLPTTNYSWIWYLIIGLLVMSILGVIYTKTGLIKK